MAKAPIDLKLYRSSVKGRRPDPAVMSYGDLAVNYNHEDPALIIKGDDNALIEFKPGKPPHIGPTAPASPKDGDLWWDTTTARLYVRYTSGTPAVGAWVDASPAAVGGGTPADASTTAKGVVQLADAAAITAGTTARVVDAAQYKALSDKALLGETGWACSDEKTALKAGETIHDIWIGNKTILEVRAHLTTAPVGSTLTVSVLKNGSPTTPVFASVITIAAGATKNTASPAVVPANALQDGDPFTIKIEQVGATTAGTGLKVYLLWRRN